MKKTLLLIALLFALVLALAACGGEATVTINDDGYLVVNGNATEHRVEQSDVITIDGEGYVIVNGVTTEYKTKTKDTISVNDDGYVVVNGKTTTICVIKDDVISVNEDGFLVVNGVTTEYEVKNTDHTFGAWTLYNEGAYCDDQLFYRICSVCSTMVWSEGSDADHVWYTVTTPPTCTTSGYDTKTCGSCGKVEICNETAMAEHAYGTSYKSDDTFHWRSCADCDAITDKAEHTEGASGACTACEMPIGPTVGVVYDVSADGTYAIVADYQGASDRVKIADTYNGLPVREVYSNAFRNKTITSVIIPDSVTVIGDQAFAECTYLGTVTLGNNVKSIGESAFHMCNLVNINLPDGLISIGIDAFYDTLLRNVTIPNSVTSIGRAAFLFCDNLRSVTLSNNLTRIEERTFEGCKRLTSITIPDSVTIIDDEAFRDCSDLESVTLGNGVTRIGQFAFKECSSLTFNEYGNCTYLGSADNPYFALIGTKITNLSQYEIHADTKVIASYAFMNCSRLTSITLPNSVVGISKYAFYGCDSLTSATFENTDGWWAYATSSFCSDTAVNVTDASAAATLLSGTHLTYNWERG